MEPEECQEDFSLTDYKVKKVTKWEKIDKKRLTIIALILSLILLAIVTAVAEV